MNRRLPARQSVVPATRFSTPASPRTAPRSMRRSTSGDRNGSLPSEVRNSSLARPASRTNLIDRTDAAERVCAIGVSTVCRIATRAAPSAGASRAERARTSARDRNGASSRPTSKALACASSTRTREASARPDPLANASTSTLPVRAFQSVIFWPACRPRTWTSHPWATLPPGGGFGRHRSSR